MRHCRAPHTINREGGDCADPTCTAHQHNEDGPEPRRPRMPCGCDASATEHTCTAAELAYWHNEYDGLD